MSQCCFPLGDMATSARRALTPEVMKRLLGGKQPDNMKKKQDSDYEEQPEAPALNLPMLNPEGKVLGDYPAVLSAIQGQLRRSVKRHTTEIVDGRTREKTSWSVLVLGHGGRDSLGCLTVLQAVATSPDLRGKVIVHVCTCSWADDKWEPHLAQYLKFMEDNGIIEENAYQ